MQKRTDKSYIELNFFKSWPGMIFGIEFMPRQAPDGVEFCFGITLFCCNLVYFEYCRFNNKFKVNKNDFKEYNDYQ